MVSEESSEILRSASGEQEGVDGGAEKFKSSVGWSEDRSTQVILRVGVIDGKIQTGFEKP